MTRPVHALTPLLVSTASGWGTCQPMKEIYPTGKELCEQMWAGAFKYETDESAGYTMWWFDAANPNNDVAASLGLVAEPDQCMLQYFHKQGPDGAYSAPSPEGANFTECHPWKDNACCHEATVTTPQAMNEGYGADYHWDRCGPLSEACERFFVQEACMYECSPHAGQYRRYSDGEVSAFAAFQAVEGNPTDPCYTSPFPAADDARYSGSFTHEGVDYAKSVFYGDGCYGPNKWQMYQMPIKASYCDAFHTACANDLFCGSGDFFSCAYDYRTDQEAIQALTSEALAPYSVAIQEQVWAAGVVDSAEAVAMAERLLALETTPDWMVEATAAGWIPCANTAAARKRKLALLEDKGARPTLVQKMLGKLGYDTDALTPKTEADKARQRTRRLSQKVAAKVAADDDDAL